MWTQSIYADEARARVSSRNKRLKEEDYSNLTDREKVLIETAYRRGYFQGYWFCYTDAVAGASREKLFRFIFIRLARWRNKKHSGKMKEPPHIFVAKDVQCKAGEQ